MPFHRGCALCELPCKSPQNQIDQASHRSSSVGTLLDLRCALSAHSRSTCKPSRSQYSREFSTCISMLSERWLCELNRAYMAARFFTMLKSPLRTSALLRFVLCTCPARRPPRSRAGFSISFPLTQRQAMRPISQLERRQLQRLKQRLQAQLMRKRSRLAPTLYSCSADLTRHDCLLFDCSHCLSHALFAAGFR